MAQSPQLAASDCTLMQAPLQSFSPAFGQVQAPFAQLCPPEQALPQAPQLAGSVAVVTQVVPQSVCPVAQPQEPFEQLWPLAQAVPHAPQLLESVAVFVQALLQ
jgi:hypothetical protein